jgi:hypothetical protein
MILILIKPFHQQLEPSGIVITGFDGPELRLAQDGKKQSSTNKVRCARWLVFAFGGVDHAADPSCGE